MTIQEALVLKEEEDNGKLKIKHEDFFNDNDAKELNYFFYALSALNKKEDFSLITRIRLKYIAKKMMKDISFIKKFSGKGTLKSPYYIESLYGNGFCFNMNEYYTGGLKELKKYNCYFNSFWFLNDLKNKDEEAELVTGIAQLNKVKIVSGVLLKKDNCEYFLDFHQFFMMDYNLYKNIFKFEEKCRVGIKTIKKDGILDLDTIEGTNLYLLCMAYGDMVKKIKSGKLRADEPYADIINK